MDDEPSEWWRTWFGDGYLALYDPYLGERTVSEVDHLVRLLDLRPPLKVLDLGCGQGRHSIELARLGFEVTGVDLSRSLLRIAAERAHAAGVTVRWLEGDMRTPPVGPEEFDLVLNLFTSFGYFDDEEDNAAVLRAAAQALRPGGQLVLELLNGDRFVREFQPREWFTMGETTVLDERHLDLERKRLKVHRTVVREGEEERSYHSLRLYGGAEIEALARAASFARVDLFGGWEGEPFTKDSHLLLVVAYSAK